MQLHFSPLPSSAGVVLSQLPPVERAALCFPEAVIQNKSTKIWRGVMELLKESSIKNKDGSSSYCEEGPNAAPFLVTQNNPP